MTNSHPRRYRVTRHTPGVDWSAWTHTYHPTLASAHVAIRRFFNGEGNYASMAGHYARRGSTVELGERREFRGYVRYEKIETFAAPPAVENVHA